MVKTYLLQSMEGEQTLRLIVLNHLDDEGQEMVQVSDGDVAYDRPRQLR